MLERKEQFLSDPIFLEQTFTELTGPCGQEKSFSGNKKAICKQTHFFAMISLVFFEPHPSFGGLGSVLCSQFYAIFANFRRKNGVFLNNECYDKSFAQFSFVLCQKRHFLSRIFKKSLQWSRITRMFLEIRNSGFEGDETAVLHFKRSALVFRGDLDSTKTD
jgi:hypothetical protein